MVAKIYAMSLKMHPKRELIARLQIRLQFISKIKEYNKLEGSIKLKKNSASISNINFSHLWIG
jgi:hypothetical protein